VKLSQVDLNLFVVFDVIFTEQNLTRVAEILHITQPAVSNALNRLRETVGDPLFVRTPKGMRPTPVAQNLIEPVRAALRQFDNCLQLRDQFDPATANRVFRINAGDIVEPILLPALAHHFELNCPNLGLEVLFMDRASAPLEMAAGNLDISIDAPLLNHPELDSQPLLRDEYVCAVRRNHPLSTQPLTLERYLALNHINISSRVRGAGHVDLGLRALGQRRNISVRLQHYIAAEVIVVATDYALSAPRRLVAGWDVTALPLPFTTPQQELNLYWHKSVSHDPANKWLRALILKLAIELSEQ
jgi:DNA-binding transcriptional LysR family regulator